MQPLGRGLAVAAQYVPDGGTARDRPYAFGQQAEQLPPCKASEKFIVERNDQLVAARVTLAGGAPEKLAINATGLVVFRQYDVQAAGLAHVRVQFDIGAAAGQVGCDRDPLRLTGVGDDFGLLAILPCIENRGLEPRLAEQSRNMLGRVDRTSSNQDGAPCAGCGGHRFDYGVPFEISRCKQTRARIHSAQRPICGYAHDPQAVYGAQFPRWLDRGSGHAAKVQVAPKEPLIGYLC